MCRSISSRLAVALALFANLASTAQAGPPPTGTIVCSGLSGRMTFGPYGLPLAKPAPPSGLPIAVKQVPAPSCDASGVIGSAFPIQRAIVSLRGKLAPGEKCEGFLDTLDFAKGKISVRWLGVNAYGRPKTVGTSKADVASAVYDSGSEKLVITTAPVARGAFAGSSLTFRFGQDTDVAQFADHCANTPNAYAWLSFGGDGTTTIEVP